ncbi:MAG: glycosyltransferase family 4 protein [Gammaproteobacteria bacterium]|nr:glycosyltransferase family 4 protein [Gammaproteobacteria bacterium]
MAGLAVALARRGCDVAYVAQQVLSRDRAGQGWSEPSLEGVRLEMVTSRSAVEECVAAAPTHSIHLCGGLRGNGLIQTAQAALARRSLAQWVVMETVDDAGWQGVLRRLEYGRQFRRWRAGLAGVLAIGHATPGWVAARGMPAGQVFPFAYFLPRVERAPRDRLEQTGPFRFLFVGQLIERKRLGVLLDGMGSLTTANFRLAVVGSGPLEKRLCERAAKVLPGRVDWIGTLPMMAVADEMVRADCLVLPSRHDGWGAVISEALMVGTPVICSDACGAAGVVRTSGRGGVFERDDRAGLVRLLERAVRNGRLPSAERASLAAWARCLGAEAGADYLLDVLNHVEGRSERPRAPWER